MIIRRKKKFFSYKNDCWLKTDATSMYKNAVYIFISS